MLLLLADDIDDIIVMHDVCRRVLSNTVPVYTTPRIVCSITGTKYTVQIIPNPSRHTLCFTPIIILLLVSLFNVTLREIRSADNVANK